MPMPTPPRVYPAVANRREVFSVKIDMNVVLSRDCSNGRDIFAHTGENPILFHLLDQCNFRLSAGGMNFTRGRLFRTGSVPSY